MKTILILFVILFGSSVFGEVIQDQNSELLGKIYNSIGSIYHEVDEVSDNRMDISVEVPKNTKDSFKLLLLDREGSVISIFNLMGATPDNIDRYINEIIEQIKFELHHLNSSDLDSFYFDQPKKGEYRGALLVNSKRWITSVWFPVNDIIDLEKLGLEYKNEKVEMSLQSFWIRGTVKADLIEEHGDNPGLGARAGFHFDIYEFRANMKFSGFPLRIKLIGNVGSVDAIAQGVIDYSRSKADEDSSIKNDYFAIKISPINLTIAADFPFKVNERDFLAFLTFQTIINYSIYLGGNIATGFESLNTFKAGIFIDDKNAFYLEIAGSSYGLNYGHVSFALGFFHAFERMLIDLKLGYQNSSEGRTTGYSDPSDGIYLYFGVRIKL